MLSGHSDPPRPAKMRMVDLFAGPGGLDVAAHWLGIPVVGVEWDDNACATRRAAKLDTVQEDVRNLGPRQARFADATILAGGPPCQTYTLAGSGAGRRALEQVKLFIKRMAAGEDIAPDLRQLDDERTGLVLEPLRWALEAHRDGHPFEAIVLEQVPAVLPVWQEMKVVLERIGYQATCEVLRTEEFGVPQTRRRAILIARRDLEPELPRTTHRRYLKGVARSGGSSDLAAWETMGSTLDRPAGFTVISNYGSGGDPKARGRRTSDEPSFTVTGKVSRNRLIGNGIELERFTHSEAGQLQTFPRDYPWSGKDIAQQIGNAIPPRLAVHVLASAVFAAAPDEEWLGETIRRPWAETRDGGRPVRWKAS